MRYAASNLEPDPGKPDQKEADEFVDWYGRELGSGPTLERRPDMRSGSSDIDGEYSFAGRHMYLEHTSFDSTPGKKQVDNAAYKFLIDRLDGKDSPLEGSTFKILPEYGKVDRPQEFVEFIDQWLGNNWVNFPMGRSAHRLQYREKDIPVEIFRNDAKGTGKIRLIRRPPEQRKNIDVLAVELCSLIDDNLRKFAAYPAPTRILLIQNDELDEDGWAILLPDVIAHMQRKPAGTCEEIWCYGRRYVSEVFYHPLWFADKDAKVATAGLGRRNNMPLMDRRLASWRSSRKRRKST